jgi:hypothetical protein
MKILIGCGKYAYEADDKLESLSMDCEFKGTSANSAEQSEAFNILQDLMADAEFGNEGRRNNDAVNFSIALHVLGYDPQEWFENLNDTVDFTPEDYFGMREHLQRIADYLEAWGPAEDKGAALKKAIKF